LRRSYPILDQVVAVMNSRPTIRVFVQGHTDNVGNKSYNQKLSQRRAEAVRKYLIKKKVKANRLDAKGFGMDIPLVPNTTRKNRAKNRRVEFKVLQSKP
jgi:outer membrane protein OmpA-like peptidoglycan-associated protein